ncbi:uncharacterized protein L199_000682 [Kwoniella botswanensis]|uniref:uncharacterized protein n=1 Tax=Kwoniella botswanensis TaxID=1268659 RepID=UPI00315DB71F
MTGNCSSESTSPPRSEVKDIHHFHRYGDIQLISKHGTILMADSRRLSDFSVLMRNVVSRALRRETEIDMREWSSESISLLLDLINVAKPKEPEGELPVLFELVSLFYNYGGTNSGGNLFILISSSLGRTAQAYNRQWAILIYADEDQGGFTFSSEEAKAIAKSALRYMTKEAFLAPAVLIDATSEFQQVGFWEAMERLSPTWQYQLFRSTLVGPHGECDGSKVFTVTDAWDTVADAFDPADDF